MQRLNIIIKSLVFLFLLNACEEDKLVNDMPDQLFSPVLFNANINGNIIELTWVPIAGASYSIDLSKDSLFFEEDMQTFLVEGVSTFVVEDLWSQSRYSARIKSVSGDENIKDSKYTQITFVTGTENIFYEVTDDNIGMNSVLLTWDNSKDVSKIVVSSEGKSDIEISLSQLEITSGEKLIEDLVSDTEYEFKIYLNDMLRGTISVITKS